MVRDICIIMRWQINYNNERNADSHYILEQPWAETIQHAGKFLIKKNDQLT